MANTTTLTEPMEAVIITGSRKGEIIELPEDVPQISNEVWEALNEVLDRVLRAINRLDSSISSLRESVRNGNGSR